MDISTVLNVKNIKLNMTARTKEEVIEELTDLLIQDGAVTNKEDFIRDVWLREELGSTGFENHIAIPHGKSSGVSRTALAIGRTQHAIPWETMDGSDVRCVILFAVCLVDQNATHIRLLAQVSGSLADEDIIAKLLVESDPHKIIALFNSETEKRRCLIPTC
ncbi:PTS system, fructose-specific IIA component [Klebsiella pneumoniae IS53]|nr:PTS fructose transporter subunit IIA [Klebsiella pneumoniae]CDL19730.1 PTS system, fructose-specific IIA component [Klebsiella pneumoniae IS53]CDL60936.1 PTS system, fructose-specific IIA component [Klebsiella pneumoniae IS39]